MADNTPPEPEFEVRSGREAHILSCERCARRKIKCDRSGDGCLNCKKAGVPCHVIARPRLPRGRRTKPSKVNSDLKARLLRLENLVISYAQHGDGSDMSISSNSPQSGAALVDDPCQSNPSKGVSKYVGSQFWSGLSQEISEVREALESSEDEDDARHETQVYGDTAVAGDAETLLLGSPKDLQSIADFETTDISMMSALCDIFLYRFHPMINVGHGPSMRALMCGQRYLDYPSGHIACKLLTFTICYGAIETLRDDECRQRFAESKVSLRQRYKTATEVCFAKAELLTTTDLTVLEAFLIYVVTLRASDSSRKAWTLVATAVRIAAAMGIHVDDSHLTLRPFHREMRRRLWHHIRILDTRSAYDRGTEKMILFDCPPVPLPLNINDVDFSFDSEGPLKEVDGYTDMTHTLLILVGSEWTFTSAGAPGPGEEFTLNNREERIAWYREVKHKYIRHCDVRVDLQWFTKQVASTMAATSLLFSARPLRRGIKTNGGGLSSDSILMLAIDVLEKATLSKVDPRGAAWDWLTFVPWHSLAVAIAELVVRPNGPVVDKAWPIVEAAFTQYSPRVADTNRGMLWRPLVKLLSKARKTRATYLQNTGQPSAGFIVPVTPQSQSQPPLSSFDLNNGSFETTAMTENQQFDLMDTSGFNVPALSDDGGIDWFQTFVDQGTLPLSGTSVGWDQWDAFISNIEAVPNTAATTYASDQADLFGLDTMPGNLGLGEQRSNLEAQNGFFGNGGILPNVFM